MKKICYSTELQKIFYRLYPLDKGQKQNLHKTFKTRSGHLLNVLCTFSSCVQWLQMQIYHTISTPYDENLRDKLLEVLQINPVQATRLFVYSLKTSGNLQPLRFLYNQMMNNGTDGRLQISLDIQTSLSELIYLNQPKFQVKFAKNPHKRTL